MFGFDAAPYTVRKPALWTKPLVAVACLLGSAGCGTSNSDAAPMSSAGSSGNPAAGSTGNSDAGSTGSPDAGNAGSPAYLVAERVFAPEGRSYYVSLVDAVPQGQLDRSLAYEFPSADVEIYERAVFIRDRVANTITRYAVTGDLKLEEQGKLSFQSTGLGAVRVRSAYLSATRAYALDAEGWRMVEWDPSKMELTGQVVPLEGFEKPGLTGSIGTPQRVGDRIFAAVGWQDYDQLVASPTSGAMLMIDAQGQASTSLLEDARLGGAYRVYAGSDGAAYVGGAVGGDFRHFGSVSGGGAFPPSGLLRIQSGASEFDPGYQVNIESITGSPGVSAVYRVDEHTVLAQIWDPDVPMDALADSSDYTSATEFVYALVDTDQGSWTRIDSIPKGGVGNAGDHVVDDKLYVNLAGATGSTVYPLTAAGFEDAAFSVPSGDLWHFQRIR